MSNIKNKHFQTGDLILYTWNGEIEGIISILNILQILFDGKACHAGILYDCLDPEFKVRSLEAHTDGVKFVEVNLNRKDIAVLRLKEPVNLKKMLNTIWLYKRNLIDRKEKDYNFIKLAESSLNKIIEFVFKEWEKKSFISAILEKITGKDNKICSNVVAEIYTLYNILINFKTDIEIITPSDLYENKDLFIIIKNFGEEIK